MPYRSRHARAPRPSRARRHLLALALLLALLFFAGKHAGRWLVAEDQWTDAEIAVVLSGDPNRRLLAAADLYQAGRIKGILVVPEPPDPLRERFIALGLIEADAAPWPERVLLASGVPRTDFEILPEHADGVITEAVQVGRFFEGRLPASLVVITSKFASRRSRWIFRSIFPETVRVVSSPTPYDPFEPDRWWSNPRNALHVAMEYQKLLVNGLTLLLRLDPV